MALNYEECEAYFQGEVRPLLFEVYTESGVPFELISKLDPEAEAAYCEVKNEEGKFITKLPAKIIKDEPAKKSFICSWDTATYSVGYYRLQVWVLINVTGSLDAYHKPIVEAKLASEELLRYIKD